MKDTGFESAVFKNQIDSKLEPQKGQRLSGELDSGYDDFKTRNKRNGDFKRLKTNKKAVKNLKSGKLGKEKDFLTIDE